MKQQMVKRSMYEALQLMLDNTVLATLGANAGFGELFIDWCEKSCNSASKPGQRWPDRCHCTLKTFVEWSIIKGIWRTMRTALPVKLSSSSSNGFAL